ncbi:MAG TPA: MFS transporter [Acidimicrobiales bacterium]|nr:MFS transporter [Acidimicrobiales bacterium]
MASRLFVDITPLRRFPQYRRLWFGYALRQFGAQLTTVTVVFQIYRITHSNLAVGLISAAQVGPGIIAPLFGGAIADAVDRRKLLMVTAILIGLSTTCLAVNCIGNHPALWVLYVMSAFTWGMNGIDGPTRQAVQMTLVDRDSIVSANALRQLLTQTSSVAGPALAGVLISVFIRNLDIVYWIDVASALWALQVLFRLPPMQPVGGGRKFGFSSIGEGFAFLKGRRVIQACFITDINATLLGLPTALFPYMAYQHFHGGAKTYGLLMSAPGLGAFIGSLLSGWTSHVRFQGRAVMIAVCIWGFAIVGFGLAPWLIVGIGCLAIAGAADVGSATLRNSIIQTETPDALRGRLSSLQSASVQTGKLGNAEAGLVAALTNAKFSIVSGGLGCVVGVLLIAKFVPNFARYQLSETRDAQEAARA